MKIRNINHNELKKKEKTNLTTNFILPVQAFKIVLCTSHRGVNHIVVDKRNTYKCLYYSLYTFTQNNMIQAPVLQCMSWTSLSCIPDLDFRKSDRGKGMSSYMRGVRRLSCMTSVWRFWRFDVIFDVLTSFSHQFLPNVSTSTYKGGAVPNFSWSKNVVISV